MTAVGHAGEKGRQPLETGQVASKAVGGARWVVAGQVSQRAVSMLTIIVLARLLTPQDFGLATLATLIVGIAARIRMLGMHSAIIHRRHDVAAAANVYFYTGLVLSLALVACIAAASPLLAAFFKNEAVPVVLTVLSVKLFIDALYSVQRSLTVKEMKFKTLMVVSLCEAVAVGAVSVALAAGGGGVWALIGGMIAGSGCALVLWWVVCPWRPTRRLDLKVLREMASFGMSVTVAGFIDNLIDALNRSFVGRRLGVAPLGYYDFTTRLIHQPFRNVAMMSQRVALPAFCNVQEDYARMKRWYLKMIGLIGLLMAPLAACLVILSDPLVPVVFGPKWSGAVPLVRILAPLLFLLPLLHAWPVYIATGRVGTLLRFTAARLLLTVPLAWFAAGISIEAFCLAELALACLFAPLNLFLISRILRVTIQELVSAVSAPIITAGVFAVTLLGSRLLVDGLFETQGLLALALIVLPASAVFVIVLRWRFPDRLSELKQVVIPSPRGAGEAPPIAASGQPDEGGR